MDHGIDLDPGSVSALYTISFARPRLIPQRRTDFCVYFALETDEARTLFTDLAQFILALGQRLGGWSVLSNSDQPNLGSRAHPTLQDLAYCWDGVACAYGVLQFSAGPISMLNIRRMFHQTSLICHPLCYFHRYEYFASGIFSDLDDVMMIYVFREMEIAARYVKFLLTFKPLADYSV